MIQLQHVCKTYGEGENAHHALRNVNLTINDGDVFGIIGASGLSLVLGRRKTV